MVAPLWDPGAEVINGIELSEMASVTAYPVYISTFTPVSLIKSVGSLLARLLLATCSILVPRGTWASAESLLWELGAKYGICVQPVPGLDGMTFTVRLREAVAHGPSIHLWCPGINIVPIGRAAPPVSSTTDLGETERLGQEARAETGRASHRQNWVDLIATGVVERKTDK